MKYVKILSLLAVAATALMAFAASASATSITSPKNTLYTNTIHAVHEGSHVTLDNPIAKIECNSTVHGASLTHGAGVTAKGNITVAFTNCTNSWHVTVIASGSLEVHNISGTTDGTLTSTGATVTATRLGIECRYATNATDVGRLTSSDTTGKEATLDITAAIPFHGGSGLCGGGATTWTGNYVVKTPTTLYVDP
ncbi:MAG TPA: hypothetical protein VFS54_04195 [Solirubrobacterales bacterium]|nr:hypothetical protein [Solirubrobacterales bacterium]